MARFRRTLTKTDKHEVTWSNLIEDAATVKEVTLLTVVQASLKNAATEVMIGSHVRGMYVEFNIGANDASATHIVHWQIMIDKTGQSLTAPNTYYNADRSQVFKRGMEMLPKDVSTQTKRVFYVRLPKTRMKEGDAIKFRYISSSSATQNLCGFAIYKELY